MPKKKSSATKDSATKGSSTKGSASKKSSSKRSSTKKKKLPDAESKQAILDFFIAENRPYNVQNIVDALRGKTTKGQAQKLMDALAEEGELSIKMFGKAKVYSVNQDRFEIPSPEEMAALNAGIKQKQEELKELEAQCSALQSTVNSIGAMETVDELNAEIEDLRTRNAADEAKLKVMRDGADLVSANDKEKVEKELNKYVKEWGSRKRKACDIIDAVTENQGTPKQFRADSGVETDEEVGVDYRAILNKVKKARR